MNNKIKKSKGFTLTELIVVIVIIGILAAVLIPTLTGYIKKANQSADEQEVVMLNKIVMLYEYDDTLPSSASDLKKKVISDGYSGDFSLRTNDSYLWYDVKENQFLIISKNDLPSDSGPAQKLAVDTSEYKLSSKLLSPEGLLNNGGSEVWLIGGKGTLVDTVNNIRNLGDYSTSDGVTLINNSLKELESINSTLLDSMTNFINTSVFYGENKEEILYNVSDKVAEVTDNIENKTNYVFSEIINAPTDNKLKEEFLKQVIYGKYEFLGKEYTNLSYVNLLLTDIATVSCDNKQNIDGSYNVIVKIINQNELPISVMPAFEHIIDILLANNLKSANITPLLEDNPIPLKVYESVLGKAGAGTPNVDLDNLPRKLDLAKLLVYAIYYDEAFLNDDSTTLQSKLPDVSSMLIGDIANKNGVQIRGTVNDGTNEYEIVYNFKFVK